MAGRPSAVYDERTTENVLRSLAQHYHGATAIPYESALRTLVTDFSAQRTTASKLLMSALADGTLYRLRFTKSGCLYEYERNGCTQGIDGFAVFVSQSYSSGLVHDTCRRTSSRQAYNGGDAVAIPSVFDQWLEDYTLSEAEKQAKEDAYKAKVAASVNEAHPELAVLAAYGAAMTEHARDKGKLSPVEARIGQFGNGDPYAVIELRGPKLDAAAGELLTLLRKHFGEPSEGV
jgi:hypothetical protein